MGPDPTDSVVNARLQVHGIGNLRIVDASVFPAVTSGNTNPLADQLPEAQFPWRSENAHLPLLTFDPEAGEVHVEFVATDGTVSHARTLSVG